MKNCISRVTILCCQICILFLRCFYRFVSRAADTFLTLEIFYTECSKCMECLLWMGFAIKMIFFLEETPMNSYEVCMHKKIRVQVKYTARFKYNTTKLWEITTFVCFCEYIRVVLCTSKTQNFFNETALIERPTRVFGTSSVVCFAIQKRPRNVL